METTKLMINHSKSLGEELRSLSYFIKRYLGERFNVITDANSALLDRHPHVEMQLEVWKHGEPPHSGCCFTVCVYLDETWKQGSIAIIQLFIQEFYNGTYFKDCVPFSRR